MAAGTIHNILSRTGKNMGTKALHIMESVKASDLLHVDETSFSLNGRERMGADILQPPYWRDAIRDTRKQRQGRHKRGVGKTTGRARLSVMAGLRTRVTIFRGAGPTYCARSGTSCARTLTVRRQNRCYVSSQMRTDVERMPKKCPNPRSEDNETFESRRKLYKYLRRRIRGILKIRTDCENLQKFRTKLGNAYEDLFRFILDPQHSPNQQRRRTRAARDRHTP